MLSSVSAFAGGRACDFETNALPLMKDQAVLGEFLQSKFSMIERGQEGPDDSPWDDVIGRMYFFMEFRASSIGDPKWKYPIGVPFNRDEKMIFFKSLEILPVVELAMRT